MGLRGSPYIQGPYFQGSNQTSSELHRSTLASALPRMPAGALGSRVPGESSHTCLGPNDLKQVLPFEVDAISLAGLLRVQWVPAGS